MKRLLFAVLLVIAIAGKAFCQKTAALDSAASVKVFQTFLMQTVRYPQVPRESGTVAEIIVAFSVDESQAISTIRVLKGLDDNNNLENEVVRSIKAFKGKLAIKPAEYVCAVAFTMRDRDGQELHPFKIGDNLAKKYTNFLFETVSLAQYR